MSFLLSQTALSGWRDTPVIPTHKVEEMEKQTIVGENGVYVIDENGINIVARTEKIKGRTPVPEKLLKMIKQRLDEEKKKG